MCCASSTQIPYEREKVSAKSLQWCLRKGGAISEQTSVKAAEVRNIGAGEGMLSEICRVKLTYEGGGGPESVIVKSTPKPFMTRLISRLFRLFQTEVAFYENKVAEGVGMATAAVFFMSYDRAHARYCIIMEDLAPDKPPSQRDGATVPQAAMIVEQLAKLHARYFNKVRASGASRWLSTLNDPGFPLFKIASNGAKKNRDTYKRAVKSLYGIDFAGGASPQTNETIDLMAAHLDQFTYKTPPKECGGDMNSTMIHGDPRIENFFFNPFVVIDFQLTLEGSPEQDVGYMLATSLPLELARKYELAVVRRYYNAMLASGVSAQEYSIWDCFVGVQMFVSSMIMNGVISTESEKTLRDLEKADAANGDTKARDSVMFMITHSQAAVERWEGAKPWRFLVDRNAGKKNEAWDMTPPTEAECREILPAHVVAYIDAGGNTEADREVAKMVADAAIVARQPRAAAVAGAVAVRDPTPTAAKADV